MPIEWRNTRPGDDFFHFGGERYGRVADEIAARMERARMTDAEGAIALAALHEEIANMKRLLRELKTEVRALGAVADAAKLVCNQHVHRLSWTEQDECDECGRRTLDAAGPHTEDCTIGVLHRTLNALDDLP
jgi:hypothetical protein